MEVYSVDGGGKVSAREYLARGSGSGMYGKCLPLFQTKRLR